MLSVQSHNCYRRCPQINALAATNFIRILTLIHIQKKLPILKQTVFIHLYPYEAISRQGSWSYTVYHRNSLQQLHTSRPYRSNSQIKFQ